MAFKEATLRMPFPLFNLLTRMNKKDAQAVWDWADAFKNVKRIRKAEVDKMTKAKQVGSWHDIPDQTIDAFTKAVAKLRDEMIPRDCDGDSAVQIVLVDRRKYENLDYELVEYSHILDKMTGKKGEERKDWNERMLLLNFKVASNDLERYLDLQRRRRQEEREKGKK